MKGRRGVKRKRSGRDDGDLSTRSDAPCYRQLVGDGAMGPDDRVELLEGVIVAMSPQSPPHAGVAGMLTQWLAGVVGSRASVRIQL